MTKTIFSVAAIILFALPLQAAEIRWGRGTATGNFIGNFTDTMNWDGGVVPGLERPCSCGPRWHRDDPRFDHFGQRLPVRR